MDRAIDVGDYFLEALKKLAEKHEIIGDIRGRGMFIGIDLVKNRETREPHIKAAEHALTRFREERILMQVKIFRICPTLHNELKQEKKSNFKCLFGWFNNYLKG